MKKLPFFCQADPKWNETLGGGETMRAKGCAICSIAMIVTQAIDDPEISLNPFHVNHWLKANKGYIGSAVVWDKVIQYAKQTGDEKIKNWSRVDQYWVKKEIDNKKVMTDGVLDEWLWENNYPIAHVSTPTSKMHFVVLLHDSRGESCFDPGHMLGMGKNGEGVKLIDQKYKLERIIKFS